MLHTALNYFNILCFYYSHLRVNCRADWLNYYKNTKDYLLTKTLSDVCIVCAVNRITQTSYNRMNLIGEVVFQVWGLKASRTNVVEVDV